MKKVTDQLTDRPTNQRIKWGRESRSKRLESGKVKHTHTKKEKKRQKYEGDRHKRVLDSKYRQIKQKETNCTRSRVIELSSLSFPVGKAQSVR